MSKRYLTKSRFKLGLNCPAKLYYTRKEKVYANLQMEDTFLMELAKGGFQVEELARMNFPNGILIEGNDWDYDLLVKQTSELLKQDNVVIYEAAFMFNNLFIRTDILVKKGKHVEVIEVKAKSFNPTKLDFESKFGLSSKWIPYLFDLAFQKHVIMKSHTEFEVKASLMMADKTKLSSIDGLNSIFRISIKNNNRTCIIKPEGLTLESLGNSVLGKINMDAVLDIIYSGKQKVHELDFYELVNLFSSNYELDKKINFPIGWHCKGCEFKKMPNDDSGLKSGFEECWTAQRGWTKSDFNKPTTFDIWSFRKGRSLFENDDKIFLADINEEDVDVKPKAGIITSSERQWIQVEKTVSEDTTAYVEKDGLKTEMASWNFPLHFIDFETSAVALPFTKGRRPYESVAFQFSHHKLNFNGTIEHEPDFISATPGEFPNFNFLRALKKNLENDNGTIFRYAVHENTILNAIYDQLSDSNELDKVELMDFIKTISVSKNDRVEKWEGVRKMVDLCDIVKKYYYHPLMKGSNGIKSVLPAILASSEYLKSKYTLPLGKLELTSRNFSPEHIWLTYDDKGKVVSPYKMLPPLFEGWTDEEKEETISELDGIHDGGGALTAYAKLQYQIMSNNERQSIIKALLKYCELDTLAMVMLYDVLKENIKK